MNALPHGRHYFRGDDGYEDARRATVWNQRIPDRYPEVIVHAADVDDVVATAHLDKVRAAYDPESRFYSWMGRV